jgi:hypothetical protein
VVEWNRAGFNLGDLAAIPADHSLHRIEDELRPAHPNESEEEKESGADNGSIFCLTKAYVEKRQEAEYANDRDPNVCIRSQGESGRLAPRHFNPTNVSLHFCATLSPL